MTPDDFNLARFVEAQERGGSYVQALRELAEGQKVSHWIWWVFPQVVGLGMSATSHLYGIGSLEEARAYLDHPVLGPRLRDATAAMLAHDRLGVRAVLGADDIKFRSSMTLFSRAAPEEELFRNAIATFFDGVPDPLTDRLLGLN